MKKPLCFLPETLFFWPGIFSSHRKLPSTIKKKKQTKTKKVGIAAGFKQSTSLRSPCCQTKGNSDTTTHDLK